MVFLRKKPPYPGIYKRLHATTPFLLKNIPLPDNVWKKLASPSQLHFFFLLAINRKMNLKHLAILNHSPAQVKMFFGLSAELNYNVEEVKRRAKKHFKVACDAIPDPLKIERHFFICGGVPQAHEDCCVMEHSRKARMPGLD
jgi:hypothetical protein